MQTKFCSSRYYQAQHRPSHPARSAARATGHPLTWRPPHGGQLGQAGGRAGGHGLHAAGIRPKGIKAGLGRPMQRGGRQETQIREPPGLNTTLANSAVFPPK